ncbi:ParB/RepB/Spo0J family partition protein [Chitinasiproducens palmae]|uniref:Chromosome segregation DNA-binding protein n=1 Tax=Chitinasiproducens palmae TaxID=1770053 RepID=A0A1H2PP52_9BURK|nr:ParB/RepB/Spo0J family partition protein [Chitinasiproducens palmae]SDV48519.1 chromosome segregation DNA-binding protein [Chitinasiproducens palmae]
MKTVAKKKGLGRGLEALLGEAITIDAPALSANDQPSVLPVAALRPGKYQPRTRMDEGALQELAASIRAQGLMQPILVRPVDGEGYEIIAGERRYRAARLAGLTELPVLVRDVPDKAAAAMALIENIQREDLNPLEEAQGMQRLLDDFKFTHEQAAEAVGRSRSAVTNSLRLLNLAQPVQTMLLAGDLDMGHARALLSLDAAMQIALATEVVNRRLSVRETEKLVAQSQKPAVDAPSRKVKPRDLSGLEDELSDVFAAAVKIKTTQKGGGQISIQFGSMDALEGVIERLRNAAARRG